MMRFHLISTMLVAGAGLAACDPGSNDTTDGGGVVCGDMVCDPNAVCSITSSGAQCVCNHDFVGDGLTCAPQNAPRTCADVKAASSSPADGPETLYVDGDLAKPWTAWCTGMTGSATPAEYLDLYNGPDSAGVPLNHSFFYERPPNNAPSVTAVTLYDRVRIDPATMSIDITDRAFLGTFAPSSAPTGQLPGITTVTSVPFATVISCVGSGSQQSAALASFDLKDTPFHLTADEFCASNVLGGTGAVGSAGGKHWDVTANALSGGCGYVMPAPCTFPPVNGNVGDARWLKLHYDEQQ